MAFIRYSVMTPKLGQAERVRGFLDAMLNYQQGRDGFITAFRLDPDEHDLHGFIGRISVWESEAHANVVAHEQHQLSLQSEIKLWVNDETHEERSFSAEQFVPASG